MPGPTTGEEARDSEGPTPHATGSTRRLRKSGKLSKGSSISSGRLDKRKTSGFRRIASTRPGSGSGSGSGSDSGHAGLARKTTSRRMRAFEIEAPQPVESDDPMVGSVVEGKYRILEPVGSGGMAVVYRAWHLMLEKTVALKLIHPRAAESSNFRDRFYREARIASELVHENIVQTREFGETVDGQFYMLMDYCAGQTLNEVIKQGPQPAAWAAKVMRQILSALASAHTRAVVHRDVKPENIMVDEDASARILDFGLAKMLGEAADGSGAQTRDGAVIGTPKYMSPEQALGQKCDYKADIYSVGMVLYELVAGRLPFEALTSSDIMRLHIVETPKPPSQVVPGLEVPADLEAAIMKALAKAPADRWESADAFKQALDRFLEGGQVDISVPTSADAFEHRAPLELPGLDDTLQAYRVGHKDRQVEGILWVISPHKLSGITVPGFLAQFEVVRRVAHPALAPNLEAGAYAGERLYAFTRWTAGQTSFERIHEGPLAEAQVLRMAQPLIEGLAKAHGFGVVHEGIHPLLVVHGAEGPVLHGLGVRPAARGSEGDASADVRALGHLLLQLLSGRSGPLEAVRDAGLERATGGFKEILAKATSEAPYADAVVMLADLGRDPRLAPRGTAASGAGTRALGLALAAVLVLALALTGVFLVPGLLGPKGTGLLAVQTEAGAQIELRGLGELGAIAQVADSDARGTGVFKKLPPGLYMVRITKTGFLAEERPVEVRETGSSPLAVELQQAVSESGGAAVDTVGADMLKNLGLQEALCEHTLDALGRAQQEAAKVGFDWKADEELVSGDRALRARMTGLHDESQALSESSPPAEIESVSEGFAALTTDLEEFTSKVKEGQSKREAFAAKVKKRGRLAQRWRAKLKKVKSGDRSAETVRLERSARAALSEGRKAEEARELRTAYEAYGKAISGYAAAWAGVKALLEARKTLKGFAEAVRSRNMGAVGEWFQDPASVMELFDGIFRRGVSLRFEVEEPKVEGDQARARIKTFAYIDRRADSHVVLKGYRILLRREGETWKVVNVRRGE